MKTAFHIPVLTYDQQNLSLLIELGNEGCSCLWLSKEPLLIKGLLMYYFEENDDLLEKTSELLAMTELSHAQHLNVTICYNFHESLLVPEKYYHPDLEQDMISLMYGEQEALIVNSEPVSGKSFYQLYRLPENIEKQVREKFPQASIHHSTSLQLQETTQADQLRCIVYHKCIKVILHKNGLLHFVQYFNYASPEDVSYHLLNACQQHGLSPEVIPLHLSGMIDQDSLLYKQLYHYFGQIHFNAMPDTMGDREEFSHLPSHYFSHLTALATCAS